MDVVDISNLVDGKVKEWCLWFSQYVDLSKKLSEYQTNLVKDKSLH
jgi:hypothetical protein